MKMEKSLKSDRNDPRLANKLTNVLFIIYLAALFWILLFKLGVRFSYMENRNVNLVPFSEFLSSNHKINWVELISNIVIFIPLGVYTGILFKRWAFLNKLLFFFLITLMFEGLQFIMKVGAFDVTDIFTNISGGIIGLLIFEVVEKVFNNSARSQRFINVIAAIGTVLILSLLVLLKLNMLPVKYQ